METGAKNMGLHYIIDLGKIKDHTKNCNASYTDPFQLKIC